MMTSNTVFIVGAGASKEVNLPIGSELKTNIVNLLDMRWDRYTRNQERGDYLILEALKVHVRQLNPPGVDINPYVYEALSIKDAMPQAISIDHFIDTHHDNDKIALCGKLAIVRAMLISEHNSLLYFNQKIGEKLNFTGLENTWYTPFFQLLTENCRIQDITQRLSKVTLIIFNYDRCIEHFIYHALQIYYKISAQEAAELVKKINIFHPYGLVGNLPWLRQEATMEFGREPQPKQLLELLKYINTYAEGTDPTASEIKSIRTHVQNANKLIFLGFAFHKLNMDLIKPERLDSFTKSTIKCFASAYGISDNDREVIKQDIIGLYERPIDVEIAPITCSRLFQEYWRSLSF